VQVCGFLLGQKIFERLRVRLQRKLEFLLERNLDNPAPAPRKRFSSRSGYARSRAVGRNHEVLDDLHGPVGLIRPQILDLAPGKNWAGFQRLQT
jgi:hypothetical protein